ncbi:hypothetical protein BDR06DRAFT_1044626 [Suillus hirtellus]|nr:hypothetical protein BDR06DRAFT_1044626 [Suillus hirtellus]
MRPQCDRQTRNEHVVPVLRANQVICEPSLPSPIDAQNKLLEELEFAVNQPHQERMVLHSQSIRSSLSGHFLEEEYLELHQQWIAQSAVLGDAVCSDLEMEQITVNLGMEELTDPSYLAIKNIAKIPDMVSVIDGRGPYSYDNMNNPLDNPVEFYSSSLALDLWTEEECIVFKERYTAHPKQFGLITQHLPNKTAIQSAPKEQQEG